MPLATSTGVDQRPFSRRESQMATSGSFSAVPPNHAATRPVGVSAMVEAWQEGKGADS